MVDGLQKKVLGWGEIGVENRDELTLRSFHAFRERARLKPFPVRAVVIGDRVAERGVALHQVAHHFDRFVRRVVKHLDIKLLARVLQLADAVDQPVGHELSIEHRQLHRDARQVLEVSSGLGRAVLPILVVEVNQDVTMHTVGGQQNQYEEIRNQQRDVECIGVVETLKRPVKEVLANVRTNPLRGKDGNKRCQVRYENVRHAKTIQGEAPNGSVPRSACKPSILPETSAGSGSRDGFRLDHGWSAGAGITFKATLWRLELSTLNAVPRAS